MPLTRSALSQDAQTKSSVDYWDARAVEFMQVCLIQGGFVTSLWSAGEPRASMQSGPRASAILLVVGF